VLSNDQPSNHRRVWTVEDIRALGAVTDLPTAAAILGIGRSTAYALANTNQFPVPVLRIGRRYRVAVAHLLRLIDVDDLTASRRRAFIDDDHVPPQPPRRHG
jgi:predicted DNA-binding transcriptional regulator AlpA